MLKTQDAIIEAIQEIGDVNVDRYYGELSNPSRPQLADGKLPLVLVDFVGDKPLGQTEVQMTYNLYVAHVSLSKNPNTRTKKHEEVLLLIDLVDKAVSLTLAEDAALIRLGSLKKIFDAKSDKGYLSVYMRQLHVTKQRNYHLLHQPSNL